MFEGPKAADVLDDILQAVIQAEARSWRCAWMFAICKQVEWHVILCYTYMII
jgi:hypothetical protein